MTTKQLNYKALPHISTFDGSTSPTLTANDKGVMAFSTLSNKPFYWDGTQWRVATAVNSINGRLGAITLTKTDVGLGSVDNIGAASLRDRTTHTGEQAIATVTGLQAALDSKSNDEDIKGYIDSKIYRSNLWLEPASVLVDSPNLTLQNLTGLTLSNNKENVRALVTSPNCAGIYITRAGAWEPAVEMNNGGDLRFWFLDARIIVDDGMGYSSWQCTSTFEELAGGTLKFAQTDRLLINSVIPAAGAEYNFTSVKNITIGGKNIAGVMQNAVYVGFGSGQIITNPNTDPMSGGGGTIYTADDSTAVGKNALFMNTSGNFNTAVGSQTLQSNATGSNNTAVGARAMAEGQNSNNNVAIGVNSAIGSNLNNSIIIGNDSARNLSLVTSCVIIGNNSAQYNDNGDQLNNVILIAPQTGVPVYDVLNNAENNNSNMIVIGDSFITKAYIKVPWTVVSDERDKTNFAAIPHGLEFVNKLKPTSYQFRESRESEATNGGVRYGFKAQDIAAIEPEAVIVDTANPEKLYYNESNLIPILVKAIQELSAEVERLKNAN